MDTQKKQYICRPLVYAAKEICYKYCFFNCS